jgi:hypothetical protein
VSAISAINAQKLRSRQGINERTQSAHCTGTQNQIGCAAVVRRSAQLPACAPLLEELEISGCSSHRRILSGNFHDWLMLEGQRILVAAGAIVGPEPVDSSEAALVAQAAWATIRAHAHYVQDAGDLLSIASKSLWAIPNSTVHASIVVAVLDANEGSASLAVAGDCFAWQVQETHATQHAIRQPRLGEASDFMYSSQTLKLGLKERLVLVADNSALRPAKLDESISDSFACLDAESRRRMMAADAVALVRGLYEEATDELRSPMSIVAVQRC